MVYNRWLLALLLTAGLACSMPQGVEAAQVKPIKKDTSVCLSPQMVKLKIDMQRVWIDHTIWTRNIVSAMSNRPDQKDVLDRLLRNRQDIGNLIKPYYGEAAGNKLTDLLKQHILIAAQIVDAAKAGNEAKVQNLSKEWHANADQIAKFLSEANPNWPFKKVQDMMYTHLRLINEIVVACLKGGWKADIAATDKNESHMIEFADFLTEGIVKQFPDKFTN